MSASDKLRREKTKPAAESHASRPLTPEQATAAAQLAGLDLLPDKHTPEQRAEH
ncbi:hypothetical protein GCM10023195_20150 [Actinoallomurus liliacearum]|uniref:Uncharacterized protein n=1 Tax=Actinoallomurus liliacearum TaxID=1080073 RepID=A0ABP8TE05_9ACTN